MTIFELQRRIKALDIETLKQIAVEINSEILVLLQKQQLSKSVTSKGDPILPKYSPDYAKKKGFSDPDLLVTGEWQSELTAIIESGQYDIVSFDEKSQWLLPRYDFLLGLNNDSKTTARPIIEETFISLYKNAINV